MRSASLALVAGLLLLTACADETDPGAEPTPTDSVSPTGSPSMTPTGVCSTFTTPTPAPKADLDGDGKREPFGLVDQGACQLLVGRDGTTPLETAALELDPLRDPRVVRLDRSERELLLLRSVNQGRGGFQPYLVGEANGVIALVTYLGEPLLPFVSTDGGDLPTTASCNDTGGIDLVTTEPSDSASLTRRWDVITTTFALDGNVAVAQCRSTEEGISDEDLRAHRHELFDPDSALADCVTG